MTERDLVKATFEEVVQAFPSTVDGIVNLLDEMFAPWPEHQRAVIGLLSRTVARDHVLIHHPDGEKLPFSVTSRYVATLRELAAFARATDEVMARRTEMVVAIIQALGETIRAEIDDDETRGQVLEAMRQAVLRL